METTRSKPHRRVEALFTKWGLSYQSECTDFPPYALDLYLGEWHLAIEVDGPQHSARKDAARDQVLREKYGVLVLHLDANLLVHQIEHKVRGFIEEHAGTTRERLQIWHSRRS